MKQAVKDREREAKVDWIEEQRQKVGTTTMMFLADELNGISGVRCQEARQRSAKRGGNEEDLRRAVRYVPWVSRSDDDAYVYHEDARGGKLYVGRNKNLWRERRPDVAQETQERRDDQPEEGRLPRKVNGIYEHGPLCDWWLCEGTPEPPFATPSPATRILTMEAVGV